jgi:hypothetical protein
MSFHSPPEYFRKLEDSSTSSEFTGSGRPRNTMTSKQGSWPQSLMHRLQDLSNCTWAVKVIFQELGVGVGTARALQSRSKNLPDLRSKTPNSTPPISTSSTLPKTGDFGLPV